MKYIVKANRVNLDGFSEEVRFVGYDNRVTDTYENIMLFDTKAEAEKWLLSSEASEWQDCSFDIIEDDTMTEDEVVQYFIDNLDIPYDEANLELCEWLSKTAKDWIKGFYSNLDEVQEELNELYKEGKFSE